MKNNLISIIKDDVNIMDALNLVDQDLIVAIRYSNMLLAEIDYLTANINDEDLPVKIYSNDFNAKIIDKIRQLKIPFKYKFILLATSIANASQTEEWFIYVLNIKEKITWKEYWIKFLEMSEPVIDQFIADMLKEIYMMKFV